MLAGHLGWAFKTQLDLAHYLEFELWFEGPSWHSTLLGLLSGYDSWSASRSSCLSFGSTTKRRYKVERVSAWTDNFGALVICYERKATHYLSYCILAAILFCLERLLSWVLGLVRALCPVRMPGLDHRLAPIGKREE